MNPKELPEISEARDAQLRETIDTVVLPNNGNHNRRIMHLQGDDGRPLCNRARNIDERKTGETSSEHWREKDMAVFPKGYKRFCRYCVGHYDRE